MQYNIVLVPKCWPINYNVIANLLSVVAEVGSRGGLSPTWIFPGGQLCIFLTRWRWRPLQPSWLHLDHLYRLYVPLPPRCSKIVPPPMPALWQYHKNNTHYTYCILHQWRVQSSSLLMLIILCNFTLWLHVVKTGHAEYIFVTRWTTFM